MGNTVGSANSDFWNLKLNKETAYVIGLWCADGYHRTSSIGLSNTNLDLVEKFSEFLLGLFPKERLKLRVYNPDNFKRRSKAYHLYVNCRPLLREFKEFKRNILSFVKKDLILPYIAGRFDGDGCVAKDFYRDCRIVYGNLTEATNDLELMKLIGFQKMKIYNYRSAKTFCLYFSRLETNKFLSLIYPYSIRLQKLEFAPRRDLITNIFE